MKRIIVVAIILLFASVLFAQKDTLFYKHEVKVSHGDTFVTSESNLENGVSYTNFSLSYFYRPVKSFWAGVNVANYFGEKTYYHWREYYVDGNFKDFSKSKTKNCAIIAPEIRFSYLNRKAVILYSGFSTGIGIENGFDTRRQEYPNIFLAGHLTLFGLSCNLDNIILGGELGIGFKGLGSVHIGYRF
jgi:hypothetical protein